LNAGPRGPRRKRGPFNIRSGGKSLLGRHTRSQGETKEKKEVEITRGPPFRSRQAGRFQKKFRLKTPRGKPCAEEGIWKRANDSPKLDNQDTSTTERARDWWPGRFCRDGRSGMRRNRGRPEKKTYTRGTSQKTQPRLGANRLSSGVRESLKERGKSSGDRNVHTNSTPAIQSVILRRGVEEWKDREDSKKPVRGHLDLMTAPCKI